MEEGVQSLESVSIAVCFGVVWTLESFVVFVVVVVVVGGV